MSGPLKFVPFVTVVSAGLWTTLARKKLTELRLDDGELPVWGYYEAGAAGRPPRFHIDEELEARLRGRLKLYNTLDEFKTVDKARILGDIKDKIVDALGRDDEEAFKGATEFLLLAYADLKKHRYFYHVLFPAAFDAKAVPTAGPSPAISQSAMQTIRSTLKEEPAARHVQHAEALGLVNPAPMSDNVWGWPARNVLLWKSRETTEFHVVLENQKEAKCFSVAMPSLDVGNLQVTGWEKNEAGAAIPKMVDLAPLMDPKWMAKEASDLNLKLIKWRLLPDLELDRFSSTRALLFGAGTLGCNVARMLLAWGFKTITLVDNGRVSFSNPPRQSLFRFDDCLMGGKSKAETAAERAREIDPNADVKGVALHIPMPGHRIENRDATVEDIKRVRRLVDEHDILFLLTDSRESRWLPTVLGAADDKPAITIALGFDSFVAMRHGTRSNGLGCYFCSDANAPKDTLSGRTLDQQCTVTRPGVSYMASAMGVELAASMLQHPLRWDAPATMRTNATDALPTDAGMLGVIPHQVRGFLTHFQNMSLTGEAFRQCTACSEEIVGAVRRNGEEFLLRALEDPDYAAQVSGASEILRSKEVAVELEPVIDSEDGDFCLL